jgi:hypothetical protein
MSWGRSSLDTRRLLLIVRRVVVFLARHHIQPSVQAVGFVIRSRTEEQGVDRLLVHAIAERDSPQPVDMNRFVIIVSPALPPARNKILEAARC